MAETKRGKYKHPGLQEVPVCPWCGSKKRVTSNRYSLKINHYLRDLCQMMSVDSSELMAEMTAYKCVDCQTNYLDPFLNKYILIKFFSERKYSHRAGWGKFLDVIKKGDSSNTYKASLKQFLTLSNFFDGADEYFEVGCPFMGFLPLLGNQGDLTRTVSYFYDNQERHVRENSFGTLYPKSISLWALNIQKMKSNFFQRKSRNQIGNNTTIPKYTGMLTTNSYLMWGVNCVGDQGICPLVAKKALGIENLTIDEFTLGSEQSHRKHRIISFMNTLDHQANPRQLFELALQNSKYVFVEIHSGGVIEKQHAFVLDETLLSDDRLISVFDSNGKELELTTALCGANIESAPGDILIVFKGKQ